MSRSRVIPVNTHFKSVSARDEAIYRLRVAMSLFEWCAHRIPPVARRALHGEIKAGVYQDVLKQLESPETASRSSSENQAIADQIAEILNQLEQPTGRSPQEGKWLQQNLLRRLFNGG